MKIGFIDYFLDEWHANNYPKMIKEASGGKDIIVGAYAMIDEPTGFRTTTQWCQQMGIKHYADMDELIKESDAIIVLSPNNCEMHEELSRKPLMSGKPVYVDKSFAPDGETARRIFRLADQYNTPCCSTSALRYAAEYQDINPAEVHAISSWGPQDYPRYSIHQLEPIMMMIKSKPLRVMAETCEGYTNLIIEFNDGRRASLSNMVNGSPFMMNIITKSKNMVIEVKSDYFMAFIEKMLAFLHTGETEISHEETIAIMEVRSAGLKAIEHCGEWILV